MGGSGSGHRRLEWVMIVDCGRYQSQQRVVDNVFFFFLPFIFLLEPSEVCGGGGISSSVVE